MPLKIEALSSAAEKGKLNTEWMKLHNDADRPFNMEGCSVTVSQKGSRPRVVTTLKAGIVIQPDERVRLVTGSSGRSSHGDAPEEEGVRNAHLYLKAPYLERGGLTVRIMNRQIEVARALHDPQSPNGVADPKKEATAEGAAGDAAETSTE